MKIARLIPLTLASLASAHTLLTSLEVDGVNHGYGKGVRVPAGSNGPIIDLNSLPLVCNGGPNPTVPSSDVITVQAGSTVTAIWRFTPQTKGDSPADIMDKSHKGPVMAYLKKVGDATSDSGVGDGWFKVQEDGLANGQWGTERTINGKGRQAIQIPQCIEPGNYLLRAEMLALHEGNVLGGAQFYIECAQLKIVGGNASKKPQTVNFPGAYTPNDAGILFNIYYPPPTSYKVPGPPVFKC